MDGLQNKFNGKSKLVSLYAYMSKRLKIKNVPILKLTNDSVNANKSFGMTGYYDHNAKLIKVYITNRHLTDILRSFAHEVIHHWQNERGQLSQTTNPHYTQQDIQMRKKEMEAYLLGNILFRDWQDEQRYGSPQKEPFLVSLNENLAVSNPTKLKDVIKDMIRKLIVNKIITSYNRDMSSAQMNPIDFIEDFANNISSALSQQIDTVNNKGNYENQDAMVS